MSSSHVLREFLDSLSLCLSFSICSYHPSLLAGSVDCTQSLHKTTVSPCWSTKFCASICRNHLSLISLSLYIYIYMCVCVCVCVCLGIHILTYLSARASIIFKRSLNSIFLLNRLLPNDWRTQSYYLPIACERIVVCIFSSTVSVLCAM